MVKKNVSNSINSASYALVSVVGIALIWRMALFVLAGYAPQLLEYRPSFAAPNSLLIYELPHWQSAWANFDGVHYLTIARRGYSGAALVQAFFPLWPLLIHTVDNLAQNTLLGGLWLSVLLSTSAVVSWYFVLRSIVPKQSALLGVLVLLLFPTSVFMGALYTEGLFLTLLALSWLAIKRQWWLVAGVLGGLAAATRVTGVLWILVLLLEYSQLKPEKRRLQMTPFTLGVVATSLGLLSYMAYLQIQFGDPLLFLHVQQEFGAGRSESLVLYPQVIWRYIKILLTARPFDWKYFAYVQEFIAGTLGLGAIILAWFKKIPKSLVIFSFASFIIPTLTGTFSSMPRYILTLPVILLLPMLLSKKIWFWLYLIISTILLLINTVLFIQGYWVA